MDAAALPIAPSRQPLSGRCLAVTRPEGQAESLCRAIRAAGGEVLPFPVLAIGPAPDLAPLLALLPQLDAFDLAFFVSPNAVHHALDLVLSRRAWPAGLRVATVGPGSVRALVQRGFSQVIAPQQGFDSESVLALPEFAAAAVHGRRVLILRGDGGRDLLADTLHARGARVECVCCYRRFRPEIDPERLLAPARAGRLDALLLTSTEGVSNLVRMVGAQGIALLRTVPVFVSHPRIASRACEAGFTCVVNTPAGDEGLLQALCCHFAQTQP